MGVGSACTGRDRPGRRQRSPPGAGLHGASPTVQSRTPLYGSASTAVTWLQYAAVGALLVAGVPRLLSRNRTRRAVAVAHCLAAVAAVAELDAVETWAVQAETTVLVLGVQGV